MEKMVLLFVGDESCGHCRAFKKQWEILLADPEMNKHFYLKSIIGDIKKNVDLPEGLDWVTNLPQIVLLSASSYQKAFDLKTNKTINQKSPLIGRNYDPKTGFTAQGVKGWAMKEATKTV